MVGPEFEGYRWSPLRRLLAGMMLLAGTAFVMLILVAEARLTYRGYRWHFGHDRAALMFDGRGAMRSPAHGGPPCRCAARRNVVID